MSVQIAKRRQRLIQEHLQRLKRELALHPSAYVRAMAFPKLREIESLLK